MEYIILSLCITALAEMVNHETLEKQLTQIMELEEEHFLAGFHQQVQKECEKAWHDRHIKFYTFNIDDL